MSTKELLQKIKGNDLSAADAMKFLSEQPNLSATALYNVASAHALLKQPTEALETLRGALTQATEDTQRQLSKEALADPTFRAIWTGEAGQSLHGQLQIWAGPPPPPPSPPPSPLPPQSRLQILLRKIGCSSRH